jgi:Major intrinsic protein
MATESPPVTPQKKTKESSSDSYEHSEDHGKKQQNHLNGKDVSRADFNQPIGGPPSHYGGTMGTAISSGPSYPGLGDRDYHHRKRQIRRRLREKHMARGPMVRWTKFMGSETKNSMHSPSCCSNLLTTLIDIVAMIGEFIGTTMFLFFAFAGTQLANIEVGDTSIQIVAGQPTGFIPGTLFYISASFGFSLLVNAWVFFRISGGLFNPAVSLLNT